MAGLHTAWGGGRGRRCRGRHKADWDGQEEYRRGEKSGEGRRKTESTGAESAGTRTTFWSHRFVFKSYLHCFLPLCK